MTPPELAAQPASEPPAILFVDDDAMVCRSMGRCLERAGFKVTTVTSPQLALDEVSNRHYDAIITDHNMPLMTGQELIDRLLSLDPALHGRIILTSGDLHTEANEEFLKRTGSRGLQKPFQVADLVSAARNAARVAAGTGAPRQ